MDKKKYYNNKKNGTKRPASASKSNRDDFKYKEEDAKAPKSACNDASWYAANSQLLKDAASLAYSESVGSGYSVVMNPVTEQDWVTSIPGVYAIHTAPAIGVSKDNASAINIAARNIYSYVRHANAGHSNYDSPDLMIYLMAMDSLYSVLSFMARCIS